jgi:hypothetical protein
MPDDKGPPSIDDGLPPMGHNGPPTDDKSAKMAEHVAGLVGGYVRDLGAIGHRYMTLANPAQDDFLFAAIETLGRAMHFLSDLGGSDEEVAVLQKVLTGLKRVGDGHRVRWLEPSGKRGRTAGIPEEVAVLRAGYAAALEVTYQRTRSLKAAAHHVASKIKPGNVALIGTKSGTPHWKLVRDWRGECSASGGGDDGMRDLYRNLIQREVRQPGTLEAFMASPHASFLRDPACD